MKKGFIMRSSIFGLSLFLCAGGTLAETAPPVNNPFFFNGYFDGSYNYLQNNETFYTLAANRAFDLQRNGLTLHQAALNLGYQPESGLGAVANVILGRDALTLAPYGYNPTISENRLGLDIPQWYLQEKIKSFTVIAGRYYSLIGVEGADPTKDTNFSRGIIFFLTPYTVMGARTKYEFTPQLSAIVGLNNGWDTIRDVGFSNTVELGLNYTPSNVYSFGIQGYTGKQRSVDRTSSGPNGRRNIIDAIVTINATEKLSFIVDYNHGVQNNALLPSGDYGVAIWNAVGGYVNYKFDEKWRVSFRGESFRDRDGNRSSIAQNWRELTTTVGYAPTKSSEIRAEVRRDFSNVNAFLAPDGTTLKSNQQSFALEGVIKFG